MTDQADQAGPAQNGGFQGASALLKAALGKLMGDKTGDGSVAGAGADPTAAVSLEDLEQALSSVATDWDAPQQAGEGDAETLRGELRELSQYIHMARQELAALSPRDIQDRFLPTAADELDAIVQATETATEEIMDATEALEGLSADLPQEVQDSLMDITTRIYQACSFQDITGQRITKVVRTLKSIEERVHGLVQTFGEGGPAGAVPDDDPMRYRETAAAVGDKAEDADLLNGPQAVDAAMGQDDIDALLSDFDPPKT
ncbi:MAG: protein phosphatase CheZ [Rhodospirillaceae bacterium]